MCLCMFFTVYNTMVFVSIPNPNPKILYMRGTVVNRTYGADKNLDISLFLLTTFGPIYYGPPLIIRGTVINKTKYCY